MTQPRVLFVCLHGSAKSVIAAEYFRRAMSEACIDVDAVAAGVEADDEIPPHVVQGLRGDGIDVAGLTPRPLTADEVAAASHVVSIGCDLSSMALGRDVEQWDGVPAVSDGYDAARSAIAAKVRDLVQRIR